MIHSGPPLVYEGQIPTDTYQNAGWNGGGGTHRDEEDDRPTLWLLWINLIMQGLYDKSDSEDHIPSRTVSCQSLFFWGCIIELRIVELEAELLNATLPAWLYK